MKKITIYHTSVLALVQQAYIKFQNGRWGISSNVQVFRQASREADSDNYDWDLYLGPMSKIPLLHTRYHRISISAKPSVIADGLVGRLSPDSVAWINDGLQDYCDNLKEAS